MDKLFRLPLEDNLTERFMIKVTERSTHGVSLHWHDFYEIELFLSGSGVTNINGKSYAIRENTLSLVTPVDFHSIQAEAGTKIDLINITFSPECIEDSSIGELLSLSRYVMVQLDQVTADRLAFFMRRIKKEYSQDEFLNKKYTENLIRCILIELLRLAKHGKDQPAEKLSLPIQKAIYYLRTHFREPITLEDVSRFSGFSPSHMSKMFREYVGVGVKEYLTELRLNQAEQWMRLSEESVTNVAEHCGFGSISHFLHVFRARYGCSPMKYRKQLQNPTE